MHRLHDKLCKQHGFINPGPVYKLSSVCPRFQAMASPAYIRALEEIKIYDVAQYEVPLFLRQDDTFGCVDDLPLKHLAAQTEAKSFLDIIKDAPLDSVDFGLLEEHMLQNKYDDLPAPFAPKVPLHKPATENAAYAGATNAAEDADARNVSAGHADARNVSTGHAAASDDAAGDAASRNGSAWHNASRYGATRHDAATDGHDDAYVSYYARFFTTTASGYSRFVEDGGAQKIW